MKIEIVLWWFVKKPAIKIGNETPHSKKL